MHKVFIICGPTGVGKTTIAKKLFKAIPSLKPGVTYTSRPFRPSAIEDKKMIHVTEKQFEEKVKNGELLEHARVHNIYYGTSKADAIEILKHHPILLNIDIKGAEQIRKLFKEQCIIIFIAPESKDQLIHHVLNRGEISDKELQTRLKTADQELIKQDSFDYKVINYEGKLEQTFAQISTIITNHLKS